MSSLTIEQNAVKIACSELKSLLNSQLLRILRRLLKEQNCYTMKKIILFVLGVILIGSSSSFAQERELDYTNVRPGQDFEVCRTHKIMNEKMQDPAFVEQRKLDQQLIKDKKAEIENRSERAGVHVYPVVFHILHNNGDGDFDDQYIIDVVEKMNIEFRRQNPSADNVAPQFQGLPTDVELEFRLATLAPDGTCFSGITRTNHPSSDDGSSGTQQLNAIRNNNDVYQGSWPGDEYINFFIVGYADGAGGYTGYPSSWNYQNMSNGIWVLNTQIPSTCTHELGHWFNLPHTWGSTNNPGAPGNCSSDDGFADTPNTIGVTGCNLNESTCGPIANVENYMSYSGCYKMFTADQAAEMYGVAESGLRNNHWSTQNLINTGADGNLFLCKADFEADQTSVCAGQTVQFTDKSINVVNGWSWSFPGGTPSTSTDQNPTVVYSSPGEYEVTLNSTDGANSASETKTAYIKVQPAATSIPFLEDFESYTTLRGIDEWEIYNPGNNAKFELNTTFGHTGTKSARLINFGQPAGQTDELISSPVDLSVLQSTDDITLSFRYSYVKRYASNDEWLKVFISPDCGVSWAQRKTIHGTLLSPLAQNSSWVPSSVDDWTTIHMTNITSNYFTGDFRYKFEFESDGGNNFYLDNINIYYGDPTDELSVGALSAEFSDVTLYPNPTDDEVNIRFNVMNDVKTSLVITDLSGKVAQERTINALAGNNLVMMDTKELAPGMYFVTLNAGSATQTLQLVVK
jgi:PKD repeat protein